MINSSAGLLTVCGRHVALWRRPLPRFMSTGIVHLDGWDPSNTTETRELPTPMLKPGFQPTGMNKDGVYMGSTFMMLSPHTLPELDVSPLLNKHVFSKHTGGSINGNDAAIKLTKAKKELRHIIHQELEETTEGATNASSAGGAKKMYIMRRHGVPKQMLQHLVTTADQWLEQKNALELWVDSSCQSSLGLVTTEGSSFRTILNKEWDHDVSLYLASMKRMVSQLGSMTPFCEDTSVLPGDLEWRLTISRTNKLPLTLFPNDPEVFPVIEWTTPTEEEDNYNSAAAKTTDSNAASDDGHRVGKIMIRMQGAPKPVIPRVGQDFLKQSHDVSLIFEASFDMAADVVQEQEN